MSHGPCPWYRLELLEDVSIHARAINLLQALVDLPDLIPMLRIDRVQDTT